MNKKHTTFQTHGQISFSNRKPVFNCRSVEINTTDLNSTKIGQHRQSVSNVSLNDSLSNMQMRHQSKYMAIFDEESDYTSSNDSSLFGTPQVNTNADTGINEIRSTNMSGLQGQNHKPTLKTRMTSILKQETAEKQLIFMERPSFESELKESSTQTNHRPKSSNPVRKKCMTSARKR